MSNRVLLIGSGGREHAIAHALSRSSQVEKIYCAPGNAGMGAIGELVSLNCDNHSDVVAFIEKNNIQLTVIGPEAPLVAGLADAIRAKNHLVVGASARAAQLEGSKIFAKKFMAKYGIPTAEFREFSNPQEAKSFVQSKEGKEFLVLKADGLAAGKGVFVCHRSSEVLSAIKEVMEDKKFGDAGTRIILEKKLLGPEVSVMALTDGKTILPFPASQDHKRLGEGDKGPNTGGMGAYTPTPFYDDPVRVKVQNNVFDNFLRGLQSEKLDFRGIIYFGLLITEKGPQVLEFNVRLGDPETQVILPMIESDLVEAFLAVAKGNLQEAHLHQKVGAVCTVVLTSGGYPGSYQKGHVISGIEQAISDKDVFVYHAGTNKEGGAILTNGGRVLNVTAFGNDLEEALLKAYKAANKIKFKNMFFRDDIAWMAVKTPGFYKKIKQLRSNNGKQIQYV